MAKERTSSTNDNGYHAFLFPCYWELMQNIAPRRTGLAQPLPLTGNALASSYLEKSAEFSPN